MNKYIRISDKENVISVVIDDCICILSKDIFPENFFKYRSKLLSCTTKEELQKINEALYGKQ